ncbi:unnamed protein product [Peniophora sp. CBMAI 1063]|nr:unnamed protein product [Peniophora sp. CBMAI 1063]
MPVSLIADVRSSDDIGEEEVLLHRGLQLDLTYATSAVALPFYASELVAHDRITIGMTDNYVTVYRGELRSTSDSEPEDSVKVVVKLASDSKSYNALIREGKLYAGPLRDMADRVVPTCYGMFEVLNRDPEDEESAFGCLILKDYGEHVGLFFSMDEVFRIRLFNAVNELHKDKHVVHGQLEPCNVMQKDGWPILIDFSRARQNHVCKINRESIHEFGKDAAPEYDDFPCKEMYELAKKLRAWRPSAFECYGLYFDLTYLDRAEDIAFEAPAHYTPTDALIDAHDAIAQYYAEWMPNSELRREHQALVKGKLGSLCEAWEKRVAELKIIKRRQLARKAAEDAAE